MSFCFREAEYSSGQLHLEPRNLVFSRLFGPKSLNLEELDIISTQALLLRKLRRTSSNIARQASLSNKMASITTGKLRASIKEILKGADLASLSAKKVRRQLEEEYNADLTHRKKEIDDIIMKMVDEAQSQSEGSESPLKKSNGAGASDSDSGAESEGDEAPAKKRKAAAKKTSDDDEEEEDNDEEVARKLQEEEDSGGRRTRQPKKSPKKTGGGGGARKGTSTYSKPCQLSDSLADVMGTDKMARKDVVKQMWVIVKERQLQDPANKQFMLCDDQLLKVFGKKRIRTFGMMKYLKDHITDM